MTSHGENGRAGKGLPQDIPVLSLFSGAGGLDLGFSLYRQPEPAAQTGSYSPAEHPFRVGLAIDWDEAAIATYNANHLPVPQQLPVAQSGDLSALTADEVLARWQQRNGPGTPPPVGIIGGPPCQAFSIGNTNPKHSDPRLRLIYSYAELVKRLHEQIGLTFFLFENVAGLTGPRHQPHFRELLRRLGRGTDSQGRTAGFSIFSAELNAQDYGVPQSRRRRFIVGIDPAKLGAPFDFPPANEGPPRTVRDAISDLPPSTPFDRARQGGEHHPNHWHMRPMSWRFSKGYLREGQIEGRSFRVLRWDAPSWTVAYGHREVHVHPTGTRRLSAYEAMLLQGFPESYVLLGTLSDQFRLVSDAVPPPLATALADSIFRALAGLPPHSGRSAPDAAALPGSTGRLFSRP